MGSRERPWMGAPHGGGFLPTRRACLLARRRLARRQETAGQPHERRGRLFRNFHLCPAFRLVVGLDAQISLLPYYRAHLAGSARALSQVAPPESRGGALMRRKLSLSAALGLVLLSNAWVLYGVWQNRREAVGIVELTERELCFSRSSADNTGVFLQLIWDSQALRRRLEPQDGPGWFDRAKLAELGFDVGWPVDS
ncbi:MAG: DUF4824 family protein, partial [Acidobacteria bacterium]